MEVLVEFDYSAEEPDELTIKKGDIIKDVSQFEEGWYIGNLNGKIGVFPDNFVKTIESTSAPKKQTVPVVETVKEPRVDTKKVVETESEENRLGTGAKLQKVTGIGLGNIFSGQPIQLRQAALKEVIKDTESIVEKTSNSVKGDGSNQPARTDHVRAQFDYQPKQPDELELHVDDIIQILDRNLTDEGWWKGRNLTTKKIGVFPDNFVSPLVEITDEANDQTAISPKMNANGASEPPKVAAKPSSLVGNSTGHFGLKPSGPNTPMVQRDSPKVVVASAPSLTGGGRLITSTVATSLSTTIPTTSTGPSVGLGTGGSMGANKWRTTSDQCDATKSRTDDAHGGVNSKGSSGNIAYLDDGPDVTNQRLTNLTSERPRQAGRRLPSKFSRSGSSPPNDDSTTNGYNESETRNKRTIPVTPNQTNPNLLSPFGNSIQPDQTEQTNTGDQLRSGFARTTDVNHRPQLKSVTGLSKSARSNCARSSPVPRNTSTQVLNAHQSRQQSQHETVASLYDSDHRNTLKRDRRMTQPTSHERCMNVRGSIGRSDGPTGSNELSRSQEGLTSKILSGDGPKATGVKTQPQLEQLQAQFVQHMNEHKQQVKDLKRQIDQLKDSNRQLRSDMLRSQRVVTERLQSLMNEIDEAKKQKAADSVELARLRSVIMQLDAKAIMSTTTGRYSHNPYSRNSGQIVVDRDGDDNGNAVKENDANSLYEEEEPLEQEKVTIVTDTGIQKNGESDHVILQGTNNTARNPVMGRPRVGQPISISRS